MSARQAYADTGMSVFFTASTVIHLAVFLLLVWWGHLFPVATMVKETYYVDIVNLPVAAPQAGSPADTGNQAVEPIPPAPAKTMTLPPQKLPARPLSENRKPAVKVEENAFAEKMAKLQGKAESREQDAALERLRNKLAASAGSRGKGGMPAATGSEVGSDYTAYVQSRLKDAFKETISYSSKNPEMVVRLVIDADGRIIRRKTERSSGDRAFELAVMRAVDLAAEKIPPPPGRKPFEGVFVFKPQGITPNRS